MPLARSSAFGSDCSCRWWLGLGSLVTASALTGFSLASLLLGSQALRVPHGEQGRMLDGTTAVPRAAEERVMLSRERGKTQHR